MDKKDYKKFYYAKINQQNMIYIKLVNAVFEFYRTGYTAICSC